jgi:hypothetical protein
VARRLDPAITVDELSGEIYRQRRRFKLKRINRYFGAPLPFTGWVVFRPAEGVPSSLRVGQVWGREPIDGSTVRLAARLRPHLVER